jgi:hypothetical protein
VGGAGQGKAGQGRAGQGSRAAEPRVVSRSAANARAPLFIENFVGFRANSYPPRSLFSLGKSEPSPRRRRSLLSPGTRSLHRGHCAPRRLSALYRALKCLRGRIGEWLSVTAPFRDRSSHPDTRSMAPPKSRPSPRGWVRCCCSLLVALPPRPRPPLLATPRRQPPSLLTLILCQAIA